MSFIKRVINAIRKFFAWLRGVIATIVGAPLQALRKMFLAIVRWIKAVIDTLVEAWRNFWTDGESGEKPLRYKGGEAAVPGFATLVMVVVCYVLVDAFADLSLIRFLGLCIAVWLLTALVALNVVRYRRKALLRRWLVAAEKKTGLLWMERVGTVVSFFAIVSNARRDPALIPLSVGCFVSFAAFWTRPHEPRPLQRWRPPIDIPPVDVPDDDRHIDRHFSWDLRNAGSADTTEMTVRVSLDTLEALLALHPVRDHDPDGTPRMDEWVLDGQTSEVQQAALNLVQVSEERRYSSVLEVSNVVAFAQSIEYALDEDTTDHEDHWRYPIETIHDQHGDCEDSTILAAAVLYRLGYEVALLFPPNHAALGVVVPTQMEGHFLEHEGKRYFYCETTESGWSVGELPDRYDGVAISLVSLARPS